MDAVSVEHNFAYALGIQVGARGEVNDADFVRASKVEYLKKAVSEACKALLERVGTVQEEEVRKELGFAIEALERTYRDLQPEGIDKTPVCFALWSAASLSMRLIAKIIENHDA